MEGGEDHKGSDQSLAMGRRKIEIQPIREERNRTVTFIKRKAGLFKKAHELAVLCQVDVAVLILGSNNTFYEFSSVDMQDMIKYYGRDDLAHDEKGPSDFGAYQKKSHITLNEHSGRKTRKGTFVKSGVARQTVSGQHDEEDDEGDEEEEEEEEEGDDSSKDDDRKATGIAGRATRNALKRDQQQQQAGVSAMENDRAVPETKKPKIESRAPKFNPLQQMVQRQFQNLYQAASQPATQSGSAMLGHSPAMSVTSQDNPAAPLKTAVKASEPEVTSLQNPGSVGSTPSSRMSSQVDNKKRPVLRVQIPSNNASYNPAVPSGSSPTSSIGATNLQTNPPHMVPKNPGAVRYELPVNQQTPKRQTPTTSAIPGSEMASKYMMPDKTDSARQGLKPSSGNSFGLPPMFSASPAFPPYLATPLQASGAANHLHGPPYPIIKQLQMTQQYAQQQQQQHQHQHQQQQQQHQQQQMHLNLPAQTPRNPARSSTPPLGDHSAGPLTGSLPSKFAHDLMVPSPNTSMSMFQDWTLGPGSAKAAPNIPSNPVPGNEIASSTYNHGSTGLTPYMMVNQTPLANRFFSFSSDATDDKNHGNGDVVNIPKNP